MPGALLKLPRWLLLLMALCVFGGQMHQMACKTGGDHTVAASDQAVEHQAAGHASSTTDAGGDCPFHCQFSASVPCGLTPYATPALAVLVTDLSARSEAAPESRRDPIDHPPQLA